MRGETYERRKVVDLAPTLGAIDYSIPDRDAHEKHLDDVARSNKGRGFPVLVFR